MDQMQEHTHTYDRLEKTYRCYHNLYGGTNYVATGDFVGDSTGTSNANSGRSGEETRVKNISIKLWQRIS